MTDIQISAREELKINCIRALANAGASSVTCNFYADALQCEFDMTHALYRMQKELRQPNVNHHLESGVLFAIIQNMTRNFYSWRANIDALADLCGALPPLQLSPGPLQPSRKLNALCSLETKNINVQEGEELTVTDASQPDRVKVRNSRGEEDYLPALCCILPTPDNNANMAVERLQIQLLTSWTECTRRVKLLLLNNLQETCKSLATDWSNRQKLTDLRDRVGRRFRRLIDSTAVGQQGNGLDLNKLHSTMFSLEKELISIQAKDLAPLIETIANLDKAILCYQTLRKQFHTFKRQMEEAARPVRIVQDLEHLRQLAHGKDFKYYEVKMTLEESDTTEIITHLTDDSARRRRLNRLSSSGGGSPGGSFGGGGRQEHVEAEQVVSSSQEEEKRFVIRAVVDPRNGKELAMTEAIASGIIDRDHGTYVNPDTKETMSIPQAMTEGLIKVDYQTVTRTKEKVEAVGLITIRTRTDQREYTITGAIDATTAERVDDLEARRRGLIDESGQHYINSTTGDEIALDDAIQEGWVFAEYDDSGAEPQYETKTYAVSEVLDQRRKSMVPFADAIRRGLIDRDTGSFVDNVTGERVYVADAIQRNLLKARLIDNDTALGQLGGVDASQRVVVERIDNLRKNVLRGFGALAALKRAGKASSGDST